ncbi:unnamed protein product [Ceratitis capitata]|uniref:(Mediterranean fruit fly) hypothetical protein n=1 Tax=Ceratitis capitata TaxID=7213 RepID=A0A811U809_CERCA|nr:unnamed protein product [Ceratitis capitata]
MQQVQKATEAQTIKDVLYAVKVLFIRLYRKSDYNFIVNRDVAVLENTNNKIRRAKPNFIVDIGDRREAYDINNSGEENEIESLDVKKSSDSEYDTPDESEAAVQHTVNNNNNICAARRSKRIAEKANENLLMSAVQCVILMSP